MGKRKTEPIRVTSYIPDGHGGWINFDTLSPEEKTKAITPIAITFLNNAFRGKAVFFEKGKDSAV